MASGVLMIERSNRLGWLVLAGLGAGGAVVVAACSDDTVGATPASSDGGASDVATTSDGPVTVDGGFVIGAQGGTQTLTLPNGQVLVFTFPASAAGKTVSLRVISDAEIGHPGELPNLVEMLPHGTVFDPPVRVEPLSGSANGFIGTFASAADPSAFELLAPAADGLALELPHFSYLGMWTPQAFCKSGTFTDVATPNGPCCPGGIEHVWKCERASAGCIFTTTTTPSCEGGQSDHPVCYVAPPLQRTGSVCGLPDGGLDAATDAADASDAANASDAADASDAAIDAAEAGSGDGGGSVSDAGGGVDGAVGAAGCPDVGLYSLSASGTCGDLSTQAPRQRIDGTGCSVYFEFNSGGALGVSSSTVVLSSSGTQSGVALTLGSASVTCSGTTTTGSVDFTCSNGCSISMLRTGPL